MWKFWKHLGGGRGSGASSSGSLKGSVADLRDKFFLEKHGSHGFPVAPSAIAYDSYRHVLYIGTCTGELNMYGKPGVECSVTHFDNYKVVQILPFQSEASIITVCSNNILNKWLIEEDDDRCTRLVPKRTYKFHGGLAKTITVCCLPPYGECLFVGTLGGITYPMDTEFDGMSPEVLSWSRARAFLKYKGKDIPGEVRALTINPTYPKQLLIGYEHGYLEIWDAMTWKPNSAYGSFTDLGDIHTACWHPRGDQFLTTHTSGGVAIWNINNFQRPVSIRRFYESSNLQPMGRILWPDDRLIVFSGGAPYDLVDGDSVTVWDGKETTTLQVTSPIKGMHIIEDVQSDMDSGIVGGATSEQDNVTTVRKVLILLLEQEILFIDLRLPELFLLQPPYLHSIHNSPLKEIKVYSNISKTLWSFINRVGKVQQENIYRAPCKVWPIDGGLLEISNVDQWDVLLTGHEDGRVKFWDTRNMSLRLMYEVHCSQYFGSLESEDFRADSPVDNFGQCRNIGFWDPRSDDDQLMVTSLKLCGEQLLVGFNGGHALVLSINNQTAECSIILNRVSIMREDPRQNKRGWQSPLELRTDPVECSPGFQPSHAIHFFPAVPVTAIAIAQDQGLLAAGCIYGFAVVDYLKNETIYVHCTFDMDMEDPTTISRMQSIRRSFRHSLQRVNIRHSMRGNQSVSRSVRPGSIRVVKGGPVGVGGGTGLQRSGSARPGAYNRVASIRKSGIGGQNALQNTEIRGRGAEPIDVQAAIQTPRRDSIRTLMFTAPTHVTGSSLVHGLLVGTNQGAVLGFTIDPPQQKYRQTRSPIVMPVEKEFNPRKNHAVLFAGVIDGDNYLLDINDSGSFKSKGTHYIIICTEDILRVTSLPNLKKKYRVKFKQNEQDDFHLVSAHYIRVSGQSVMVVMDSEGYLSLYTLPELKLIYKENCVDAADAVAQRNFVCSSIGLMFYQKSPSEFIRGSISDETRVDVRFTLPAKAPSPPQVPVRFTRPLSDGPHLVDISDENIGIKVVAEVASTDGALEPPSTATPSTPVAVSNNKTTTDTVESNTATPKPVTTNNISPLTSGNIRTTVGNSMDTSEEQTDSSQQAIITASDPVVRSDKVSSTPSSTDKPKNQFGTSVDSNTSTPIGGGHVTKNISDQSDQSMKENIQSNNQSASPSASNNVGADDSMHIISLDSSPKKEHRPMDAVVSPRSLPDHFFTRHTPELRKKDFEERAL